jgi:UDP-glucose 4-epimerase
MSSLCNDYCIKKNVAKVETFNLGTGTGSSVLEVIKAEKVSGQELPYKMGRREGDITRLMLIQIKQILFLDGKPILKKLWRGLEMGTESEKSRIIIMKSVLF